MSSEKPDHSDPLRPHSHEPNPRPPGFDPAFLLVTPDGHQKIIRVSDLMALPPVGIDNCYIVSTGHGTSGPFRFLGARLLDLVTSQLSPEVEWSQVEVVSADGFGNRVFATELTASEATDRPIILAYAVNGQEMTRHQGIVRMIVPAERDDALRQVKWVGRIEVKQ
jgi:hypothetical protein